MQCIQIRHSVATHPYSGAAAFANHVRENALKTPSNKGRFQYKVDEITPTIILRRVNPEKVLLFWVKLLINHMSSSEMNGQALHTGRPGFGMPGEPASSTMEYIDTCGVRLVTAPASHNWSDEDRNVHMLTPSIQGTAHAQEGHQWHNTACQGT
jgi:hypothetical protein